MNGDGHESSGSRRRGSGGLCAALFFFRLLRFPPSVNPFDLLFHYLDFLCG